MPTLAKRRWYVRNRVGGSKTLYRNRGARRFFGCEAMDLIFELASTVGFYGMAGSGPGRLWIGSLRVRGSPSL